MTTIDTAALRAAAEDAEQAAYAVSVSLHPATVRALCDGYDEAQRLRDDLRRYYTRVAIPLRDEAVAAERQRIARDIEAACFQNCGAFRGHVDNRIVCFKCRRAVRIAEGDPGTSVATEGDR